VLVVFLYLIIKTCFLFTVMARLSLTTRNMIKKKKLILVLMFWIDILSVVTFFELLCILVEYHI
jgi:hypothetical protein